jgi:hypothetical protein
MSNVGFIKNADNSNYPIFSGDSGSAVIGNFGGTYKIVGLAFASDGNDTNNVPSTVGVFCRIDYVAQQLNISSWDGQNIKTGNSDPSQASYIYRPASENRTSIQYNGKTYYQAGLVSNGKPITNV